MFTVKLFGYNEHSKVSITKLFEADTAYVYVHRPNELFTIEGMCGDKSFAEYLSPNGARPDPDTYAREIQFYREGYIMNESGATVERVRFHFLVD